MFFFLICPWFFYLYIQKLWFCILFHFVRLIFFFGQRIKFPHSDRKMTNPESIYREIFCNLHLERLSIEIEWKNWFLCFFAHTLLSLIIIIESMILQKSHFYQMTFVQFVSVNLRHFLSVHQTFTSIIIIVFFLRVFCSLCLFPVKKTTTKYKTKLPL